ncbi:MAG: hypothetical protein CSA50_07725 [Gammaproteobacteria bacterium]|nr:MAG: hypothetical protein CSA50_07725 [Gammaproteobacteria bacterium]
MGWQSRIKQAKTDSDRNIFYDPDARPEVSNLLPLLSLIEGGDPTQIGTEIGDGGSGKLKARLTEGLNEHLRPLRQRRTELESNMNYVVEVLKGGVENARLVAQETLSEVRKVMNMER